MMLKAGIFSLLIAVLAACGVYALKNRVQTLEADLKRVQRQIAAEELEINRLRAEWATLNHPSRLARLAEDHLELIPAGPRQIARIEDIPLRRDLDLDRQSRQALVGTGIEGPLRFKPSATLMMVQELQAAEDRRARTTGRAAGRASR
jgi:cell division protein FtsL